MNTYPLNTEELKIKFNSEKNCVNYLYKLRWGDFFTCPRCQCNNMWKINDSKYKCKECNYQTTITSGTYLQRTHLSLQTWFKIIWHIVSQRTETSAMELQESLHLGSNRTALNALEKVRTIMKYCDRDKLRGEVYIDDIPFHTKRYTTTTSVFIAVEMINDNISRIRLHSGGRKPIDDFVKEYVELGSTIHIKCNQYYATVPNGYFLIRDPQVLQHTQHPKLYPLIKELRASGLYASTQRYPNSYKQELCIAECSYKFNRRNIPSGEMFYEILHNAMHMQP